MIKDIYYKIAVSTIFTIQESPNKNIWKVVSMIFLSVNFTLNVILLWLVIDEFIFSGFTSFLSITYFSSNFINLLVAILIYILLPIITLNYFLIFKDKKYESLLEKYSVNKTKKMFAIHFLCSYFFGLILMILIIFSKHST